MRKRLRLLALTALAAFVLSGCASSPSSNPAPTKAKLVIQISKTEPDGTTYQRYKTIEDASVVAEIRSVLIKADESRSSASMSRASDRKLEIMNAGPTVASEIQVYGIWFSPEGKLIEVVMESGQGGYIQLNPDDSKKIRSIL
ncbi:hypothetical protein [Cohnella boryungensis]|uniref:Lipoprotein n=1 Tax=Cohnella boryungensis TaxID=768479 RepID=A0ABV8SA37_9BACL